jgi:hypothetical protein
MRSFNQLPSTCRQYCRETLASPGFSTDFRGNPYEGHPSFTDVSYETGLARFKPSTVALYWALSEKGKK